jgi:hypothetical protein
VFIFKTLKSTYDADRRYFTSFPMPQSTHDFAPCMNVIDSEAGASHIRGSIGRLAQPIGLDNVLNAISPLDKKPAT